MVIVTGGVVKLRAGVYTFLNFSTGGAGTCAATIKDERAGSTAIALTALACTGSAVMNLTLGGDAMITITLGGDSVLHMLDPN